MTPLTPALAKRFGYGPQFNGLVVMQVAPGSPAQESGVEVGDLITKYVNKAKITPASSVEDFEELVKSSNELNVFIEDVNHRLPGEFKTLSKSLSVSSKNALTTSLTNLPDASRQERQAMSGQFQMKTPSLTNSPEASSSQVALI